MPKRNKRDEKKNENLILFNTKNPLPHDKGLIIIIYFYRYLSSSTIDKLGFLRLTLILQSHGGEVRHVRVRFRNLHLF